MLGVQTIGVDPEPCPSGYSREQCGFNFTTKIASPDEQIIIHDHFRRSPKHDIALIRLNEPAPSTFVDYNFDHNIMPICLPWSKYYDAVDFPRNIEDGYSTLVLGWGLTLNDTINQEGKQFNVGSTRLLPLKVPIANNRCGDSDKFSIDTNKQVCAGGEIGEYERKI